MPAYIKCLLLAIPVIWARALDIARAGELCQLCYSASCSGALVALLLLQVGLAIQRGSFDKGSVRRLVRSRQAQDVCWHICIFVHLQGTACGWRRRALLKEAHAKPKLD